MKKLLVVLLATPCCMPLPSSAENQIERRKGDPNAIKKHKINKKWSAIGVVAAITLPAVFLIIRYYPRSESRAHRDGQGNNDSINAELDNYLNNFGDPYKALKVSLETGETVVTKLLIDKRAIPNSIFVQRALKNSIEWGKTDIVKYLFGENEQKVSYVTNQLIINEALLDAAGWDKPNIMAYLLEKNNKERAYVSDQDIIKNTLLDAAKFNSLQAVKYLFGENEKKTVYITGQSIREALKAAVTWRSYEVLKYLLGKPKQGKHYVSKEFVQNVLANKQIQNSKTRALLETRLSKR